ncbi:MAG: 16S rRNA (adenine(1518)-N(6)/adenine(1519)-N(6))-dimethyltransferase, partial [Catonella sp.]
FQAFVQAGFKQRRKTLWNNLKSAYVPDLLSEDSLRQVFDQAGIEPNRRAESLSLMDFADLEAAFEAHKAKG